MKRLIIFIITAALLLCLCACGAASTAESGGEGLEIIATVFPAYDFARVIAGDRANVRLLLPPGSEAHSYEPTAQDILRLRSCDLLVCNGGESESWLSELLDGSDKEIPMLAMLDCVNALEEETVEGMQAEHQEHDGEPEYDEHVWTSPVNAVFICRAICDRLCDIDIANTDYYRTNLENYVNQLQALDGQFREIADAAARKTVVFADRFPVRYFVEEYGLDYYAAFPGCAEDAEPSAETVAFLIDKVRAESIPAVFYIEFSNQKMADIICEETGCQKLLFHACHNVGADELKNGVSYLSLMEGNVETLREALS